MARHAVERPDREAFRALFPVLARAVYLNAGTNGPLPQRSADVMHSRVAFEAGGASTDGDHRSGLRSLMEEARTRLAQLTGATPDEIALTDSTTSGVNIAILSMGLCEGDEVITTDEEHAGVLAPLAGAQQRLGIRVRVVPFAEIAGAVASRTRLIACSHVSWMTGRVAPVDELADLDVPVLLDGAQAIGAIPVDVRELGCDFYAGSGQKWLCGPDRTGALFVAKRRLDDPHVSRPSNGILAEPRRPFLSATAEGARQFDLGILPGALVAGLIASLETLESAGWTWIHDRGRALAAMARERLEEHVQLVQGGRSTLVSWRAEDSASVVRRLRHAGVIVRDIPGHGLVRGSFGAWTSEDDIDRLVVSLGAL